MERHQFSESELAVIEQLCVPLAVYQFIDKRVVTLALSEGFCELFGYDRDEAYRLMDNDMYRDTHPDDAARIADAAFRFAAEGGEYNVIYRSKARGENIIVHAIGKHVYTPQGTRIAIVWYTDEGPNVVGAVEYENTLNQLMVSALHSETLYKQSRYDHLTGLPGMMYFFELAEAGRQRLEEEGKQTVLLYINLVGMRFFNDKYGFAEGDKLINAVSKVLVRHFSNENCSRTGQDHFLVYTSTDGLEETLQQIFKECELINEGRNLPVSVGIYNTSMGVVDVTTASDRAKYACYVNRDAFVSQFNYFDESMLAHTNNQRYIIDNLDRAISEGWIKVYYQPIVRTTNGRVCDEEALARWVDPEMGLLSPADFIPVLEEAKLIYKLDLCVLDQILEKMKRQMANGECIVPQSLNLSRTDFDACDIVEEICKRVDAAGVGRDKLTVEITESVVGSDFEFMKRQVERFRSLGFKVWMDDFGSGYSSLDVLQNIQFDLIKLDMRFMDRFEEGDESKIILTELVKMAIGLGFDTVAEGVETESQAEFLKEVGCSKLQGFFFSKPIPLEEVAKHRSSNGPLGIENPRESEYYATIGKINLYDMAVIANESQRQLGNYLDAIPMAVIETDGDDFTVIRSNRSYRDYLLKTFGVTMRGEDVHLYEREDGKGTLFLDTLRQCALDGDSVILDEDFGGGESAHSIIKRVAQNPVTGVTAMAVVVLAVTVGDGQRLPVSFAHIAKALSADYRFLFYVDLETERFIEYGSDAANGGLAVERHGESFFETSRIDAGTQIYEPDRASFIKLFTKENVIRSLDADGSFTITYRQIIDDEPRHMIMKAARMGADDSHIIIGVSDVDVQTKRQEAFEKAQSEQLALSRIAMLTDEYMSIYIVDLETERFQEHSVSEDYEGLGLIKGGEHFFEVSKDNSFKAIHPDDQELFRSAFTKQNVLKEIEDKKRFVLNYRLMIDGQPVPVRLKAVKHDEPDGARLIVGTRGVFYKPTNAPLA